ncbi:hypothetical protein [Alkaliflexus imshenetskii]|uniref:hypothetical protein n=1 Tax=Alkaliflexus imshenetskii TaxID=286730 RepID=UPI00047951E5|nr:hypothetical protein [Alkaliflexus imshenetskii]
MRTIALILVLTTTFGLCRAKEIREDWIKIDSIFINLLKKEYLSNPTSIEKYLEPWEKKRENLGYGYSIIDHSMGKGYVSIFYTLIYKDKKLVSFKLTPQMPNDSRLYSRYLSFYEGFFENDNYQPQSLFYGYKVASTPIKNFDRILEISPKMEFFMTPYSGIIYGDYGGIANELLENRELFNSIKSSINDDLIIYLLNSINPATRLYATELFMTQKELFIEKKLIEELIEMNFKELSEINTMSGCIQYSEDARKVIKEMMEKNK